MTRANATPTTGVATPIPTPRVVRERSIRRGRLGIAVALMAIFALAAVSLFGYVSRMQPYLALARDVPVGAQLTAADLVTVHLNPAPELKAVPSTRTSTVVGKYASVTLLSGMLLTGASLVDKPFPAPGEQIVGLSLKPGQMPSTPLRPGAPVLLVAIGDDAPPAQANKPATAAPTVPATVVHVIAGARDGSAIVSVAVRESDGPLVARLAAQGRLVLTLMPGN